MTSCCEIEFHDLYLYLYPLSLCYAVLAGGQSRNFYSFNRVYFVFGSVNLRATSGRNVSVIDAKVVVGGGEAAGG